MLILSTSQTVDLFLRSCPRSGRFKPYCIFRQPINLRTGNHLTADIVIEERRYKSLNQKRFNLGRSAFSNQETPLDNTADESFFACMKREKLSSSSYDTGRIYAGPLTNALSFLTPGYHISIACRRNIAGYAPGQCIRIETAQMPE